MEKKQLGQQKKMDQLKLDIQKERLEMQKQTEIKQKLEEILLQTQQEQRN